MLKILEEAFQVVASEKLILSTINVIEHNIDRRLSAVCLKL